VLERLRRTLREAEVVCAREVLLRAVDAPRREQLFRADHAECFAQLIADEILPAIAAREGEIRDIRVAPLPEPGDEPRVLVVGMRGNDQHAHRHREAASASPSAVAPRS